MQIVTEIGEHRAPDLAAGIGLDDFGIDHWAIVNGGHILDSTVAANFDAVIPAGQSVTQVPAQRKARAPVGAAVFPRMDLAVAATPDNDVFAEPSNPDRLLADRPTGRDRVPQIAQSAVQQSLDGIILHYRVVWCAHRFLTHIPGRSLRRTHVPEISLGHVMQNPPLKKDDETVGNDAD